MKAILSSSHSIKSPKFATLTVMAATCAMLLSAPVNAAETDATATPCNHQQIEVVRMQIRSPKMFARSGLV